jgi:hypothetical protein
MKPAESTTIGAYQLAIDIYLGDTITHSTRSSSTIAIHPG